MKIYQLTQDKNVMFEGTEDSCFMKLQRMQSNSATWAMRHEGWKITEKECTEAEAKEILKNDPFAPIECEILEDIKGLNKWVKVKVLATGEVKEGNINAMCYTSLSVGSKVTVTQSYLSNI